MEGSKIAGLSVAYMDTVGILEWKTVHDSCTSCMLQH